MASRKRDKFNCSYEPIFTSIPVDHVVMYSTPILRIADQLINQLLKELGLLDNVRTKSVYSALKHKHTAKFESFVKGLGIEWNFWLDRSSKEVKSRDFTGPEHWKIFTAISVRDLIPDHTHVEKICKPWKTFIDMMTFLKKQRVSCEEIC